MATFSRHQNSVNNVGSYQVSGYPYISGSTATMVRSEDKDTAEYRFMFPRVAKSVTVIFVSGTAGTADNGGGSAGLRVHFHSTGTVADANGDWTVAQGRPTGTPSDGLASNIVQTGSALDNVADGTRCTSTVIVHKHYVELNATDESITFDVKCKEIFVSRADCRTNDQGAQDATDIEFRVIAELTNIPCSEMGDMRGCGLTEAGAALGQDPNTRIVITDDS